MAATFEIALFYGKFVDLYKKSFKNLDFFLSNMKVFYELFDIFRGCECVSGCWKSKLESNTWCVKRFDWVVLVTQRFKRNNYELVRSHVSAQCTQTLYIYIYVCV